MTMAMFLCRRTDVGGAESHRGAATALPSSKTMI
jgi:hypothetical protein